MRALAVYLVDPMAERMSMWLHSFAQKWIPTPLMEGACDVPQV